MTPLPFWYPRVLRLADVVEQRREARAPEVERRASRVRADVLDDGEGVGQHVLVAMDRVLLQPHRRQLGQELVGEAGVDAGTTARRPDGRRSISLSSSSRIRSADTISSRSCIAVDRVDELGFGLQLVAGDEAGGPQHPQRVVAEAHLGRERRAQPPVARGRRRRRTDRRASGWSAVSSSAIALTVKSRRDRSASMSSANATSGLRESAAYASARWVVISYSRSPCLAPDRAEPLALGPDRVGPPVRAAA